jgi:hypothetical protein
MMEEKTQQQQKPRDDGAEVETLRQKLKIARLENQLTVELANNGAGDLETAALVAKARIKATGNVDVKEIVKSIKEEKPFLFSSSVIKAGRTQPARQTPAGKSDLTKAAKKASQNATRQNVFEYMKARRGWEVELKR